MSADLFSLLPLSTQNAVIALYGPSLRAMFDARAALRAAFARRPRNAAEAEAQRDAVRAAEAEITRLTRVLGWDRGEHVGPCDASVLEDRGLFTARNRREAGLGAG